LVLFKEQIISPCLWVRNERRRGELYSIIVCFRQWPRLKPRQKPDRRTGGHARQDGFAGLVRLEGVAGQVVISFLAKTYLDHFSEVSYK